MWEGEGSSLYGVIVGDVTFSIPPLQGDSKTSLQQCTVRISPNSWGDAMLQKKPAAAHKLAYTPEHLSSLEM